MSTIGCHNCKFNLKEYEELPYEQWPCASCPTAKNYSHTFATGYFDSAKEDELEAEEIPNVEDDHIFVTKGDFPLQEEEIFTLESIKYAIVDQVTGLFSGLLIRLLHIAKTDPIRFEVLVKKMQFPYMSYSEIGNSMNPKCSKQNVLYHLKGAIAEFPELEKVIHIDTRYSGGHYALKTLADKKRKEQVRTRLQQQLFGEHYNPIKFSIDEINKIIQLPFNVDDDVFTFNAYLADEEHIRERNSH